MAGEPTATTTNPPAGWRLGHTSEHYESGSRGPGTISSGNGDAGGQNEFRMRKATITFVIALAFLVHGAGALADDSTTQIIKRQAPKGITNTFYACLDKAGSENIPLAACLSAEKRRQDARLNAVYKSLLGKLDGTAKEDLIRAERAWLELNNASQDFDSSLYGNESVANLQVTQNGIFRLCERANTLEKYLSVAND